MRKGILPVMALFVLFQVGCSSSDENVDTNAGATSLPVPVPAPVDGGVATESNGEAGTKPCNTFRCSADRTTRECTEPGGKSEACAATETCIKDVCVKASSGLGDVVVVTQGTPASLTAGTYAVAVVETESQDDTQVPFPIEASGDLANTTALRVDTPPELSTATLAGRCGTIISVSTGLPELNVEAMDALPAPSNGIPQVGATHTFYYPESSGGSFVAKKRTARLRAIGQLANFWEDQTDKAAGQVISDAALADIVSRYDHGVLARDEAIFGKVTDVDKNGKVDVLFTDLLPSTSAAAFTDAGLTLRPPGYYSGTWDFGVVVYSQGPDANTPPAALAGILAHETQHLIYFAARLAPYLAAGTKEPASVYADTYVTEGMAELAMSRSGQFYVYSEPVAIGSAGGIGALSLARLMRTSYLSAPDANAAMYGMGAFVLEYLFDQAGGVAITGEANVRDEGGLAVAKQVTKGAPGFARLAAADGRPVGTWYRDFATALLVSSLGNNVSATTKANHAWSFAATTKDAVFGGAIGPSLDYGAVPGATRQGPVLARTPWSKRGTTIRKGGLAFHELAIGETGGTVNVTSKSSAAILIRHATAP